MAYGVKLINNLLEIIISSIWPTYQFLGKYTLTATNDYSIAISSLRTPMVFVLPQDNTNPAEAVSSRIIETAAGEWQVFCYTSTNTTMTKATDAVASAALSRVGNIDVLIFTVPGGSANTGHGMNIWNQLGHLTFTTTQKIFQSAATYTSSAATLAYSNNGQDPVVIDQPITTGTIPTNWAAMCGSVGWAKCPGTVASVWTNVGNQAVYFRDIGVGRSADTTVKLNWAAVPYTINAGGSAQTPTGAVTDHTKSLFIDVSKYTSTIIDCYGESTTEGLYSEFDSNGNAPLYFYNSTQEVTRAASENVPAYLGQMIGKSVNNRGIRSTTTADMIQGFGAEPSKSPGYNLPWYQQMAETSASLIIINTGINDAYYISIGQMTLGMSASNFEYLVTNARDAGKTVVLQTPNNVTSGYRSHVIDVVDIIRSVATRLNVPLVDGWALTQNTVIPDGVHPTRATYRLIAREVYQTIKPLIVYS